MSENQNEKTIAEIVNSTLRQLKTVEDNDVLYAFIAKLNKTANLRQYSFGGCQYKIIKLDEYEKIKNDQLKRTEHHPERMASLFMSMPLISKVRFLNKIANTIFSKPNQTITEINEIVKHEKMNENTKTLFREITYRISVNDKDDLEKESIL